MLIVDIRIYVHSANSSDSVWMPWELGYFDGYKPRQVDFAPCIDIRCGIQRAGISWPLSGCGQNHQPAWSAEFRIYHRVGPRGISSDQSCEGGRGLLHKLRP